MTGKIHLRAADGSMVEMAQEPYDSEALLQQLLEDHPSLLAGEQMTDGEPRRWLLLAREKPVSSEAGAFPWYLDHLFVDQDGVPTLVEVKRSSDLRIRREVVGQMLDYAANGIVRWSVEELSSQLVSQPDGAERLNSFLEGTPEQDFWIRVRENLETGRIRMVFVADRIPPELRRIVEFLSRQLRIAEIFAVEVPQYSGAGFQAFVPRLVSSPAREAKAIATRQWSQETFLEELARQSPDDCKVAIRIMDWARSRMPNFWFGRGTTQGSCAPQAPFGKGRILLFILWTYGNVEMQFQHIRWAPFGEAGKRREMIRQLNEIPGIVIPEDADSRRPSFPMRLLREDRLLNQFLGIMEDALSQIKGAGQTQL